MDVVEGGGDILGGDVFDLRLKGREDDVCGRLASVQHASGRAPYRVCRGRGRCRDERLLLLLAGLLGVLGRVPARVLSEARDRASMLVMGE